MTTKLTEEVLWAGTEASFNAMVQAKEVIHTKMVADSNFGTPSDNQDENAPYLYERQGNVGVITIRGSLVNETDPWNRYFGLTNYADIRDAVMYAAADAEAQQILLDIVSGGGAVSGVEDTAKLIALVNDKVKPVTAFTDGVMASAAYWLGCSASEVYCTSTSVVGSIGVLITHMERSKMLADAGIGVTVIRSGKYKALANGVEPLSKEGEAQMKAMVDAIAGVFTGYVADRRHTTVENADSNMGQGREFMGQAAAGVGLVDGVMSFDKVMSLLAAKSIDTSGNFIDNSRQTTQGGFMPRQAMTEQQIAALAAGASLTAETNTEGQAAQVLPNGDASTDNADASANSNQEDQDVQANTNQTVKPESSAVIELLQSQLKEKESTITAGAVEIAGLKAKVSEMEASFAALLDIAAKATNNMRIAANLGSVDFTGKAASEVLAAHASAHDTFKSMFKAGGVATVDAAARANEPKKPDADHMARVKAAGG